MKNFLKITLLTTSLIIMASIEAFATNVSIQDSLAEYETITDTSLEAKAYREQAKIIRAEIDTYTSQIKEIRDYNSSVNQKLKALNERYKADKNSISNDKMKQIKELRKSIKSNEKNEKTVKEDSSIKSLVKNKEYNKALARLNEILEEKKEQLRILQERNAIWRQIDALIG